MRNNYNTHRLLLNELSLNDTEFMLELINGSEWIKFIGDRNINSKDDATGYIQKIIDNTAINYWVVKLRDQQIPIGIVTFIKKDYLDHHDIGFAFLAEYTKQGYAGEAVAAVLEDLIKDPAHECILATTIIENTNSIQLLKKLGFEYDTEIISKDEKLLVYYITADKLLLNSVTKKFYGIFANTNQQKPEWNIIYTLCIPETIIIKKTGESEIVYNLHSFIEPRREMLSNGTLTDFEEFEIEEETKILGNIAQRYSKYKKRGCLNEEYFNGFGNKLFQFIKTNSGWKINSIIWEDI